MDLRAKPPPKEIPLHEDLPPRSGWPFLDHSLSLRSTHCQLGKAVERSAKAEKTFNHAGEQIHTTTDKLVFVQFHLDAQTAREGDSRVRRYAREVALASNREDTVDHILGIGGATDIVDPENLLQRFLPFFDQRQIVQRQM